MDKFRLSCVGVFLIICPPQPPLRQVIQQPAVRPEL